MISPTVGRVVWFRPGHFDRTQAMMSVYGDQPMKADVVFVWSDHSVNLVVTDHAGRTFFRSAVSINMPAVEGQGHAEWMPYQKAVAIGQIAPTVHAEPSALDLGGAGRKPKEFD